MTKKKAAIYIRVGREEQLERSSSLEQQVAECEEYAEKNNMTVVNIYADRAVTGKTDNRPE